MKTYKLIRITTVSDSLKILLSGQLKFMSKYFNVIAISSPGESLNLVRENEGVRVIPIPMERKPNPVKDIISIYKLYKVFKREKPDIVHTHTPKAGMVGMIAAFLSGVPIRLHTVAGLPLMTRVGLKKKILILIEWLTYKFATMVYPNSYGLSKYIESLGIIEPQKLKVIGNGSTNGIDLDQFDPDKVSDAELENIRNKFNISKNDFIYIFIGRIVKDKGVNELVVAFKELSLKYTQIKLLLLGKFENNLDPVLPETMQYLENSEKVILAGYQTDIKPFLKLADVFVHPSYREGFPNVVMQACAFNKAIIVTNINGSNEIIENNINGLVVPVANVDSLRDAMESLFLNREKRENLSKNNRTIIKQKFERNFVWNQILNEYYYCLNLKL